MAEPAADVEEKPQIGTGCPSTWVVPVMAYRSQADVVPVRVHPLGASRWGTAAGTATLGAAKDAPGGFAPATGWLAIAEGGASGRIRVAAARAASRPRVSPVGFIACPQLVVQPAGGSMRKTVIMPPNVAP